MEKTLKIGSKSEFGSITFRERKDGGVTVTIDFEELFKTSLSLEDKMMLIEALNEMEEVFIDYINSVELVY